MPGMLKAIGYFVLAVVSFTASVYVGQSLYNWHIVPLFHAHAITFLQAWGLSLSMGYLLCYPVTFVLGTEKRTNDQKIVIGISSTAFAFLCGLFVHWLES